MGNSNNTGRIMGALLLGAAIGGALGILFAPDKGSETRRRLSEKSDGLTDALKEKFKDFLEGVKEEVETAKDKAKEFMGNGSAQAEQSKVK